MNRLRLFATVARIGVTCAYCIITLIAGCGCDHRHGKGGAPVKSDETLVREENQNSFPQQIESAGSRDRCLRRDDMVNFCWSVQDSPLNCKNDWGTQVRAAKAACSVNGKPSGASVSIYNDCGGYAIVDVGGGDVWETWYY